MSVVRGRSVHRRYLPQVGKRAQVPRGEGETGVRRRRQLRRRVGVCLCRCIQGEMPLPPRCDANNSEKSSVTLQLVLRTAEPARPLAGLSGGLGRDRGGKRKEKGKREQEGRKLGGEGWWEKGRERIEDGLGLELEVLCYITPEDPTVNHHW